MWTSLTELGCTMCGVCGASVKTGSSLSLLSIICIRAQATYSIMETASALKSGQEVFSRKPFCFCFFFCVRFLLWIYSALGNALTAWIIFRVLWKLFLSQAFEVLSHGWVVLFFALIVWKNMLRLLLAAPDFWSRSLTKRLGFHPCWVPRCFHSLFPFPWVTALSLCI